jgi:methylenetetrahydrofolate--tRNA-(uracil-5-)-methyltransferase
VDKVMVAGAGLAGCECALALARRGVSVRLFEMKPARFSEAHVSPGLAELVCSNSFRAEGAEKAIGVLKMEAAELGSLVMDVAGRTRIPAGKALAVDRERFSAEVTALIEAHPQIELVRAEVTSLDSPLLSGARAVVLSPGPLASEGLAASLAEAVADAGGGNRLYFHDAIAPIVSRESVDLTRAFWGSRYRPEDDDYLNCPLTEGEYRAFLDALLAAEKVEPRDFEKEIHFEGCLPIEEMARRGEKTLAYGPLKPVGLTDPRTGERPYAVVQLRAENREKTSFNLVGFQTKLKYHEQKRVFSLIPGLRNAEFLRLGSIHRNTYVNAPEALTPDLELAARPGFYLAGQITGVEGYLESAACGLWVGVSLAARLAGARLDPPPTDTALGALLGHLREKTANFQPSNANFGLMPALGKRAGKKRRMEFYGQRARESFAAWLAAAREAWPGLALPGAAGEGGGPGM